MNEIESKFCMSKYNILSLLHPKQIIVKLYLDKNLQITYFTFFLEFYKRRISIFLLNSGNIQNKNLIQRVNIEGLNYIFNLILQIIIINE